MNQIEVRKMISEKGKCVKIINNFKFSFQKKLVSDNQWWNCTTKICKAFLIVDINEKVIFNESKLIHNNHEAISEQVLNIQEISNSLKRNTVNETLLCERPSMLLHAELKQHKIDTITTADVLYIKKKCTQSS
jgi:hypothetical protein